MTTPDLNKPSSSTENERHHSRSFLRIVSIARAIRAAWVVIGLSLLLLVAVETMLRLGPVFRGWLAPVSASSGSQPAAEWMPAYLVEHQEAVGALLWTPYIYYRTAPFSGQYINVDSAGSRITIQDVPDQAPDVFLMGGSTLFGSFQRDGATLPSALAHRMAACGGRPRLHNFAQSGRVFTHEVVDLMLKLRAGARPKVVVFYDGINDVAAAVQSTEPGLPINENHRVRDFELGRDLFAWETTFAAEARALGRLVLSASERLQVLRLLRRALPQRPQPASSDPVKDVTGDAVLASYVATARWVQALSAEYAFVPIFVWQPTLHTARKPLTADESALLRSVEAGPYGRRLVALHRDVASKLDAIVRPALGASFVNLVDVFSSESTSIYMDGVGHTNEAANERLAEVPSPVIADALTRSGAPLACGATTP